MPEREIYLLSPRALSPETIAVAFAKTSRSPESFRDIAAELSDEKSAQFHEKWVVGMVTPPLRNMLFCTSPSRMFRASPLKASSRIDSPRTLKKSTRYQRWGQDDFTIPPELDLHPLRAEFVDTIRFLFRTYADSLDPVRTHPRPLPAPRERKG
ncbi:MAG: hypothetical protein U0X93_06710 [Anaerolineales bacterium]